MSCWWVCLNLNPSDWTCCENMPFNKRVLTYMYLLYFVYNVTYTYQFVSRYVFLKYSANELWLKPKAKAMTWHWQLGVCYKWHIKFALSFFVNNKKIICKNISDVDSKVMSGGHDVSYIYRYVDPIVWCHEAHLR